MAEGDASSTFVDTSEECAICLESLEEEQSITLSCGHRWHLHCVREQLRVAEPDYSKPLLFTGYRCAKCARFCQHPLLDGVTRSVSHLSEEVEELMLQQAETDCLHLHEAVRDENGAFHGQLLEFARRIYAFYMCSICESPYFGGTMQCAERAPALATQDRVCPHCSPRTSATCTNTEHTPFYVWKCRFCCNPATFVCYGSTHLCARCHDEDDGRANRANITTKPCRGQEACTQPMPTGENFHRNGASKNCEQLYHCGACESAQNAPFIARQRLYFERGAHNLIYNPSGEHGLQGWHQLTRTPWSIESTDIEMRYLEIETNFVSSYLWCKMVQVVDLRRFVRQPSRAVMEFTASFMARTDCPSEYLFEAAVYDEHGQELRYLTMDEPQEGEPDFWYRERLFSPATENACFALLIVSGRDKRFWAGHYGAKVAGCRLRVNVPREHHLNDGIDEYLEAAYAEEMPIPSHTDSRRIADAFLRESSRRRGASPRSQRL